MQPSKFEIMRRNREKLKPLREAAERSRKWQATDKSAIARYMASVQSAPSSPMFFDESAQADVKRGEKG